MRATATALQARSALPPGMLAIGSGLLVLGVTAYAFLAIASRALDDARLSSLSVLWVLVFTVGPGIFLPVEQEVARLIARAGAGGPAAGRAVAAAAALALGAVALVCAACAAFARPIADALFAGDRVLVLALALCTASLAVVHLARGVLAGRGHFSRYSLQLGLDGCLRALGAAALWATGATDADAYALVLAAAPLAALLMTASRDLLPRTDSWRSPHWAAVSGGLVLLLGATTASQLLANVGVIVARVQSGELAAVAGALLSALVIVRIPLLGFAAVQAALVPRLTTLLAQGRGRDAQDVLVRTSGLVVVVSTAWALGCLLLGPFVTGLLFANDVTLGRWDFFALAMASTVFMLASLGGYGLLAMGRHGEQCLAWTVGLLVLAVLVAIVPGTLRAVEVGFAGGSLAAAVVVAAMLHRHIRTTPAPGGAA